MMEPNEYIGKKVRLDIQKAYDKYKKGCIFLEDYKDSIGIVTKVSEDFIGSVFVDWGDNDKDKYSYNKDVLIIVDEVDNLSILLSKLDKIEAKYERDNSIIGKLRSWYKSYNFE